MIKTGHIFKELLFNIIRNPGSFLSALLSMTLLLLLFDLFWIGVVTSDNFYDEILSEINMEAYIEETADDSTVTELNNFITGHPGVKEVTYYSKEEARNQLTRLVGVDLLIGYDSTNPLPRSFLISFENDYLNSVKLESINNELSSLDGIDDVFYGKVWIQKAEKTKAIILKIGMALGILIILTILFNSANNMRLTAKTRAVGLYQMRLLGAGKIFLSMPYFLEGLIIGAFSAGLGWALIGYFKDKIDFTMVDIIFPSLQYILIFCCLSALLGLISGYMGIRKQMKL